MNPLMIWKVPTISSMMAAKVTQPTQAVGSGTVDARLARRVTGVEALPGEVVLPVSDMVVPLARRRWPALRPPLRPRRVDTRVRRRDGGPPHPDGMTPGSPF